MYDTVECPYCGYDNDMSDGLDDLPYENKFDHECYECERDFQVNVEFNPEYYASEIKYHKCDICGDLDREPKNKGFVHPYPKTEADVLCTLCWKSMMLSEYKNKSN